MNRNLLRVFFTTLIAVLMSVTAFSQKADVQVSTNADLEYALSNPAYQVIEIIEAGYYQAIEMNAEPGLFLFKGGNHEKDVVNCCIYSIQTRNNCVEVDDDGNAKVTEYELVSNVVVNQEYVNANGIPESDVPGLCPDPDAGYWECTESPTGSNVVFDETTRTKSKTTITVDKEGVYKFKNTWKNKNGQTLGSVNGTFIFFKPPKVALNMNDEFCAEASGTVKITSFTVMDNQNPPQPVPPRFMKWEWKINGNTVSPLITAAPSDIANQGDVSFAFTPENDACGEYNIFIKVDALSANNQTLCGSHTSKTFYIYDTPQIGQIANQKVCGLTTQLENQYTVDCDNNATPVVTWSKVSGPGAATFSPTDANNTEVTVSQCGEYVFEYKVQNGVCVSSTTTTVKFYDKPVLENLSDSEVCGLEATLKMNATAACAFGDDLTINWQPYSGQSTIQDVNVFETGITVPECGVYEFLAIVKNGPCVSIDTVTVKFYDTPTITMPDLEPICGRTTSIVITPNAECQLCEDTNSRTKELNYVMFNVNESHLLPNSENVTLTFTLNAITTGEQIEHVTLTFPDNIMPVSSENIELNGSALTASLNGQVIDYTGLINAGTPVDFDVIVNVGSQTGLSPVKYIVESVQQNPTGTYGHTGKINLYVTAAPSDNHCLEGTLVPMDNRVDVIKGENNEWGIVVPKCGIYDFLYTAVNGPCTATKTFTMKFFDEPDVNLEVPKEVCGLEARFITFNDLHCLNGGGYTPTWTLISPLDEDVTFSPTTTSTIVDVTVSACGEYTFEYEMAVGPCTTVTRTTVYFYDEPKITIESVEPICGKEVMLNAVVQLNCANNQTPTIGWEALEGASFSTTITPLDKYKYYKVNTLAKVDDCGEYVFTLLANNGLCETSKTVTVKFFDTPVITDLSDKEVCGNDANLKIATSAQCVIGNALTTTWELIDGAATVTFENKHANETAVHVSECGIYKFLATVINGPCVATETVTVKFYDTPQITVDAPSAVCGDQVTITVVPSADCELCETATNTSSKTTKELVGAVFAVNQAHLLPNSENVTLTFTLTPTTTGEQIEHVSLTFPANIVPVSSGNIELNGGALAASLNGQVVDYTGLINAGTPVNFNVIVNVGNQTGLSPVKYIVESVQQPNDPTGTYGHTGKINFYVTAAPSDNHCLEGTLVPMNNNVIVNEGENDQWGIKVPSCGTYDFLYTAVNGPCTATKTITITFFEAPDLVIEGATDVTTCSEEVYKVTNMACVVDGQKVEYTWIVNEGIDNVTSLQGETVTISYNGIPGDAKITVEAKIVAGTSTGTALYDIPMCSSSSTITVKKEMPKLTGQVKYWNAFETYMPTPFSTQDYATYPHDYFYVTLLKDGNEISADYSNKKVQPRLMEDLQELLSYFTFDIKTQEWGCESDLQLKIWDGGLVYHNSAINPPLAATHLGNSFTYNNWGGVNATDGLIIQYMANKANLNGAPYNMTWINEVGKVPAYGFYSHAIADVNSSNPYTTGGITALDKLTATYRSVGLIANYPHNGNDNQFTPNFRVAGRMVNTLPEITFPKPFDKENDEDVMFTHSGADYEYFTPAVDHAYTSENLPWKTSKNYINVYYAAIGDVDASYVPQSNNNAKSESDNMLAYKGAVAAQAGDVITIPVKVQSAAKVNAITLMMNYRNDLVQVLSTNYDEDNSYINHENGIVNIAWSDLESKVFEEGDVIAEITVKVLADIEEEVELFSLSQKFELADITATVIEGVTAETVKLSNQTSIEVENFELSATNHPNPFTGKTTINYVLPESGKVTVEVFNNQGMLVTKLVDAVQSAGSHDVVFNKEVGAGIYFYNITVKGENNTYSVVKKMIVQ